MLASLFYISVDRDSGTFLGRKILVLLILIHHAAFLVHVQNLARRLKIRNFEATLLNLERERSHAIEAFIFLSISVGFAVRKRRSVRPSIELKTCH